MSLDGYPSLEQGRITRQFEDVDRELARLAYLCDVDLSDDGNVRGVIADNLPSAAARNPPAFKRMRDLLMLHYILRERAVESIGAAKTQAILDDVISRIRARFRLLGHPGARRQRVSGSCHAVKLRLGHSSSSRPRCLFDSRSDLERPIDADWMPGAHTTLSSELGCQGRNLLTGARSVWSS